MPPLGGIVFELCPRAAAKPPGTSMSQTIETQIDLDADPDEPGVEKGAPWRRSTRSGLGLIGVGAFGAFAVPHLAPFFDLLLYDAHRDVADLARRHGARVAGLAAAAAQDIVVVAVPLAEVAALAEAIAPHVRPGALVVDVCSVKVKPLAVLAERLPAHVEIVGTHPLFGPQSGREGIRGLSITVCPVRGRSGAALSRFFRHKLGLHVQQISAEIHDAEMAYVQGLTHLLSRMVLAVKPPEVAHGTPSFGHLMQMVEAVRHDSDELFRTITAENPFVADVRHRLLRAAQWLCEPERTAPPAGEAPDPLHPAIRGERGAVDGRDKPPVPDQLLGEPPGRELADGSSR
jgi:prephenate dehydrogenase